MRKSVFIHLTTILLVLGIVALSIAGNKKYHVINPATCDACGTCAEECPEGAISEGKVDGKDVFIIDPEKCNYCGVCVEVCPQESIYEKSSDSSSKIKDGKKKEGEVSKEAKKKKSAKKKTKKVSTYTVK